MPIKGGHEPQELYYIAPDGTQYKVNDIPAFAEVTTTLFDTEELHENCTVQILRNSVTGEISLGWWENDTEEDGKNGGRST